jgi:hypothetical protein
MDSSLPMLVENMQALPFSNVLSICATRNRTSMTLIIIGLLASKERRDNIESMQAGSKRLPRCSLISTTLHMTQGFPLMRHMYVCIFFVRGAIGPEKSLTGAHDVLS